MERDRSGIEMRPGEKRGQFDLAQERRGRISAPGPIGPPLWRSRNRDGFR